MSGHNKWSTIKRKKGATDAKRSKVFTKVIKEITVAARMGGGDPDGNPRLRRAVDLGRSCNMPNDTVSRAIKKGTGELEGVNYEELLYEGVGPAGSLYLVEAMTDNRNRTASELRIVFDKNGGQMGAGGSSGWAFDKKGVITLPADASEEEPLFELAVGAGAEDLERVGEEWVITTAREELESVREALVSGGLAVSQAILSYIPKTPKEASGLEAAQLVRLFEALDDNDDVQSVYADFELSDDALAELS